MGAQQGQVLTPPTRDALRGELVELVERDLLGPAGGESEVLPRDEQPHDRYLIGLLAPSGLQVEADADEDLAAADESEEDGKVEPEAAQESLFPSSFGMSFRVDGACKRLRVEASWGRYDRVDNPDGEGRVWERVPSGGAVELDLALGRVTLGAPDPEVPDVRVEAVVRRLGGEWSVTVFLRNDQPEPDENRDRAWLFQAKLAVVEPGGGAVFVSRPDGLELPDREDQLLAVSYRRHVEHAVGHNVAVHAVLAEGDPTRAVRLETTSLPHYELPQMRPPTHEDEPLLDGLELDMEVLGHAADGELPALLEPLVVAYGDWVEPPAPAARAGRRRAGDTSAGGR